MTLETTASRLNKHPQAAREATAMSAPVWSCNEWDPLEEVIVGNVLNARYPHPDPSTHLSEYAGKAIHEIPSGPFPQAAIDETAEDLSALCDALTELGIVVKRPDTWPHSKEFSTIHWSTTGYYNYCPRDIFLVIGDQIIETPNTIRGRAQESYSYRRILLDYLQAGARWYSAPKPMLLDSLFDVDHSYPIPKNDEPVFDAANILRLGRDIVYLISATGNDLGAKWLQIALGSDFRVHLCRINYFGSHIDSSLIALRPGLLLANPERVRREMLPPVFDKWQVIYSPPLVGADRFAGEYLKKCIGSRWIGMNLFSIRPDLVAVDKDELPLIRLLEAHGVETLPLRLRHSRMLGGGFHCVTLDTKRRGAMESYS
jgi:N-dimethylarginine dimethylaminohydrolase